MGSVWEVWEFYSHLKISKVLETIALMNERCENFSIQNLMFLCLSELDGTMSIILLHFMRNCVLFIVPHHVENNKITWKTSKASVILLFQTYSSLALCCNFLFFSNLRRKKLAKILWLTWQKWGDEELLHLGTAKIYLSV